MVLTINRIDRLLGLIDSMLRFAEVCYRWNIIQKVQLPGWLTPAYYHMDVSFIYDYNIDNHRHNDNICCSAYLICFHMINPPGPVSQAFSYLCTSENPVKNLRLSLSVCSSTQLQTASNVSKTAAPVMAPRKVIKSSAGCLIPNTRHE